MIHRDTIIDAKPLRLRMNSTRALLPMHEGSCSFSLLTKRVMQKCFQTIQEHSFPWDGGGWGRVGGGHVFIFGCLSKWNIKSKDLLSQLLLYQHSL